MIAAFGAGGAAPSTQGIGVAFVIDAASFLVSLVTLWLIRSVAQATAGPTGVVLSAIGEAVRFVWNWPSLPDDDRAACCSTC